MSKPAQKEIELMRAEIRKLWKGLHLAAGLISTMPQYEDRNPHDVAKWLYLGMPAQYERWMREACIEDAWVAMSGETDHKA